MIFEQLLGFPSIEVKDVKINDKEIIFEVEFTNKNAECPICKRQCENIHEFDIKKVRDRHLLDKRCWIILHHRRFKCNHCNKTFMERLSWLDEYGKYTTRYAEWIKKLGKEIDVKNLSKLEGIGYKTVERIVKNANFKLMFPDKNRFPIHAGIDEFALRKGRGNFCVVINDNKQNKPYDILPSRENDNLISYFQSIPKKIRDKVKSITIDIWKSGIKLLREFFTKCQIIIDRFHVMKSLNKCIDKTRRRLQKLINKEDSKRLKNLRWIMLKNGDDLREEEKEKLIFAFERSKALKQIYEFKEKLRSLFEMRISKEKAKLHLRKLIDKADKEIPHRAIKSFIKTYNTYEDCILNYFNERKSNGLSEGIINKIKLIKRKAFGMTNFYNFSGRVFQAFNSNYSRN